MDSIAIHRQQAGVGDDRDAEDNDSAAQRDQSACDKMRKIRQKIAAR